MNRKEIEKSVEEFNKYRSPEAKAKLISVGKESLEIEFTGSFCETCGFYDYFEDFRLILEERGLGTRTGKIKEIEKGAKVEFVISK
ncbi:MAG: hypothetical protein GTN39_00810 [Candidatus Aenigmarchaeota archaeon]|nr:hypothetical protein [Candidatus Aenigmarchaeota archaeon]